MERLPWFSWAVYADWSSETMPGAAQPSRAAAVRPTVANASIEAGGAARTRGLRWRMIIRGKSRWMGGLTLARRPSFGRIGGQLIDASLRRLEGAVPHSA